MTDPRPRNDPSDSASFWHGKRVIVTGGAGFLGIPVVAKLMERGASEVIVPRSERVRPTRLKCHKPVTVRHVGRQPTVGGGKRPVEMVIHLAARG